jgi:hypothetical protein
VGRAHLESLSEGQEQPPDNGETPGVGRPSGVSPSNMVWDKSTKFDVAGRWFTMATEARQNPSLHRQYPLPRMQELDMQFEARGKAYTYIILRGFQLVVDNVKNDIVNGVTIRRVHAELMPNAYLKDAVDALSTQDELFRNRGGCDLDGNEAFEEPLPEVPMYLPGYRDFCKLFRVRCMVSGDNVVINLPISTYEL